MGWFWAAGRRSIHILCRLAVPSVSGRASWAFEVAKMERRPLKPSARPRGLSHPRTWSERVVRWVRGDLSPGRALCRFAGPRPCRFPCSLPAVLCLSCPLPTAAHVGRSAQWPGQAKPVLVSWPQTGPQGPAWGKHHQEESQDSRTGAKEDRGARSSQKPASFISAPPSPSRPRLPTIPPPSTDQRHQK